MSGFFLFNIYEYFNIVAYATIFQQSIFAGLQIIS